jgi:hypothetical protein
VPEAANEPRTQQQDVGGAGAENRGLALETGNRGPEAENQRPSARAETANERNRRPRARDTAPQQHNTTPPHNQTTPTTLFCRPLEAPRRSAAPRGLGEGVGRAGSRAEEGCRDGSWRAVRRAFPPFLHLFGRRQVVIRAFLRSECRKALGRPGCGSLLRPEQIGGVARRAAPHPEPRGARNGASAHQESFPGPLQRGCRRAQPETRKRQRHGNQRKPKAQTWERALTVATAGSENPSAETRERKPDTRKRKTRNDADTESVEGGKSMVRVV